MIKKTALTLLLISIAACSQPTPAPTNDVKGVLLAGPVCPVESNPPDPNCAPFPVAGANVIATSSDATVTATSDQDGRWSMQLTDGDWIITPQPVEGFFTKAEPFTIRMAGAAQDVGEFFYDTGIR